MLRIIAGKYKGRKLFKPDESITRPTMDRTKEAIFSIIQFKIEGAIVLDLFSGSGALALESVSRGALKAIAVDNNRKAIDIINKNISLVNANNLVARKNDVLAYIKMMSGTKFDFVFMDPPYKETALYNKTLVALKEAKLLSTTGLIILETNTPEKILVPDGLAIQKSKRYGKSTILLIANNI